MKTLAPLALCVLALGCGESPTAPTESAVSYVSFSSTVGDWVGQGQSARFEQTNEVWIARYNDPPHGHNIEVFPHSGSDFILILSAPSGGHRLTVGSYESAQRFSDWGHGGVSFAAFRRGCNQSTGRFVIHELKVGAGDVVERLRATFEQQCQDGWGNGSLRGEISIVPTVYR